MLQLLSGHYPTGSNQIAVTPELASELNLSVGDTWPLGGKTVVGIVQNPQSLLDEFALGPPGPGEVPDTGERTLRRAGVDPGRIGSNVSTPGQNANSNAINPDTIVLAVATVGMLLIALVSIGGFTVLAQRRLRALGMLEAMGATDRNVRLVIRANGVIVGIVGAVVGFALGLVAWLAYRPHNEQSAHHVIPMFALPWTVIVPALVLAVVATLFAADRPARAITQVPVVSALAGRPAPPRQIHRSFVPGVIAIVIGFFCFSASGAGNQGSGVIWLIPGFVALITGIILVAPFFLALLARIGRRAPIAIRLPLRDLSRYRARSGSALSAISVGVLIAVVICAVAVARYSNVVRLRRPELGVERARRLEPQRPERQQPRSRRSDGAGHGVAGGRCPFHRSCGGRHRRRGTRQSRALCRPAKPQCLGSAVGRTDLRGDAGAAAGLRHQPVLHSLRRRCAQLASRPFGLGRAADLRRRRRKGRRPAGRPRLGRRGSRSGKHEHLLTWRMHRPPRRPRREPAAHGHGRSEHVDHRECAAPPASGEPEQPRRLDPPSERSHHLRPDHQRPSSTRPPTT